MKLFFVDFVIRIVIFYQINELEYLKPKSNEAYIGKIRKRLNEDESARNEREKRRRKVLVEQMRAHETQEVMLMSVDILARGRRGARPPFHICKQI